MSEATSPIRSESPRSSDTAHERQHEGLLWSLLALAVVPALFLTQAGWIAADTKVYLYVDPGRLIKSAQSMWNPNMGLGTVTHQNIGYLFPMGPYYWLIQELHIPMWVGQRMYLSALFLAAGGGVLFVGRLLKLSPAGRFAGAMLYMLSPFVLDYISRSTALLLPWAGLGWMLGFTILALRTRQWRWAAAFAIVTCAVGGVNATAILFVGVAPVLWILYVAFLREVTWRTAGETAFRIGLLSGIVSLWWASGLWAEGAYGLNVLKYTETIPTVTATSSSAEVWRGLGYWYFYGWDKIEPWTLTASNYIAHAGPILLSFALPVLAIVIGFLARWRYRAFAVILIAAGVIFAVSAFPFDHPSPFGALLKAAADKSTIGLAMRSTNRVIPLVVLGLALLVASGITAIREVRPAYGTALAVIVAVLAAANLAPLYQGTLIAKNLEFPNTLPRYVTNAASYLNKTGTNRVLGIPGEDFGYYRWGVTMDPIWPGLLTRPWVSRGSVPVGEPASANLVRALDTSIEDGVFNPETLAPFAQLMSAGDVLVQNDQQYPRFANAHPQALSQELTPTPSGFGFPVSFGPPVSSNTLVGPIDDEVQLGVPTGTKEPRSLVVYKVAHPRALARTEATTAPVLLAGDGEGLLAAAGFNLFSNDTPLFYSASLSSSSSFKQANAPGSTYVVTDTNAKRLDSFGTLSDTYGYVQTANDTSLTPDPSEQVLGLFPATDSNATKTIALLSGAKSIAATSYGYPTANFPEYQPFNAFDGNPNTAWEAGGVTNPLNEAIQITLNHAVTTNHVTLLQPQFRPKNRHITQVTLTFDGGSPVNVTLNGTSLTKPGQLVTFPARHFTTLRVTIKGVTGSAIFQRSLSAVGFASIDIGGVAPGLRIAETPDRPPDQGGRLLAQPPAGDPHAPAAIQQHLPPLGPRALDEPHRRPAGEPDVLRLGSGPHRRLDLRCPPQRRARSHLLDDLPLRERWA